MHKLNRSLGAWNTPRFREVFKQEAGQLGVAALPLQHGLSRSSHVSGDSYEVLVLSATEEPQRILVKAGIFYQGIIAGCSCADDPTPIIVSAALDKERMSELCLATLNMFVSILGAEAGNLALKVLATGGVYVGGGIPPRILPALEDGRFMEAFVRKGRMSDHLARMPVKIILNPKAGLLGAASRGLEL